MVPTWKVCRTSQPVAAAPRQQDRVYQLLLRWSQLPTGPPPAAPAPTLTSQEVPDAHRAVCPSVHATPSASPNH
jgi:hypothetical protein